MMFHLSDVVAELEELGLTKTQQQLLLHSLKEKRLRRLLDANHMAQQALCDEMAKPVTTAKQRRVRGDQLEKLIRLTRQGERLHDQWLKMLSCRGDFVTKLCEETAAGCGPRQPVAPWDR